MKKRIRKENKKSKTIFSPAPIEDAHDKIKYNAVVIYRWFLTMT